MKVDVIKLDASKAGQIDLSDAVFGIEEIRADILQRCVVWQLAKRRAGTHKVQVRNEVSRTSKKMYKQKGTGGARHGSRRAAQFVGGARAFGPVVRSHEIGLPKKVRALALRHALSAKLAKGQVLVVENWELASHKTKGLVQTMGKLGVTGTALLVGVEGSDKLQLAAGNSIRFQTIESLGVNVYELLKYDQVVFSKDAVLALQEKVKP